METPSLNESPNTREEWINELRRKYLDGSLEAILIPDNPKMERLMEDLFPEEDETPSNN